MEGASFTLSPIKEMPVSFTFSIVLRFIEHGEYRGNLYGTTLESVRELIAANFVPVINPHPMALKRLKVVAVVGVVVNRVRGQKMFFCLLSNPHIV